MHNKTEQQVFAEISEVNEAIANLQNKQTRLNLLAQFQKQGATRRYRNWYVSGNRLVASS